MNNKIKYYIVTLKNLLINNSKSDIVFAVYENEKYYDLLTNKEIYIVDEEYFVIEKFLKSNCKLIGIKKEEYPVDKISLFLKFITNDAKNILIDQVNDMEKSILKALYDENFNIDNKVKRMKKEDFLRNY